MARTRSTLALACLLAATATGLALAAHATDTPAAEAAAPDLALPADGPVSVRWQDPAGFTEMRTSAARWDMSNRGDWVRQLAEHLRESAQSQLPAGERLDVTIVDVKRAGDYEPWRGPQMHDVRIVRDIYPPRMTLEWRRTGADGQVLGEGERRLVDGGYLSAGGTRFGDSDPLRYEKRMIDRWLRESLASPGA